MIDSRQQREADFIANRDSVTLDELCDAFDISSATARRDLATLEEQGFIVRFRGGARSVAPRAVRSLTLASRSSTYVKEKTRIATAAFSLLHDRMSIMLEASSTVLKLTELIAASNLNLTVVTNYLPAAMMLEDHQNIELLFIGGTVEPGYASTAGDVAESYLEKINFDIGFLGADGIDPIRGLTNNRLNVIPLKNIVIDHSSRTIALIDHSKFSINAVLQIAPLTDVDLVITDDGLDDETFESYRGLVSIVRAP